jgi:hypothetical protein
MKVDRLMAPPSHLLGQRSQFVRHKGGLNHNNGLTVPHHLDLKVDVSDGDQFQMIHLVIFTGGNQTGSVALTADTGAVRVAR